jgi:hypothetical protein
MATVQIGVTLNADGKSIRIMNKTGNLASPNSIKVYITGSLSAVTKDVTLSGASIATLLTGENSYVDLNLNDIYSQLFAPDDFYKVYLIGRDAGGNSVLTSNIDAFFSSYITEGIVSRNMLAPIEMTDKSSLMRRLSRALIIMDGLRILSENLTIDKEISVVFRIKLLKRDFS